MVDSFFVFGDVALQRLLFLLISIFPTSTQIGGFWVNLRVIYKFKRRGREKRNAFNEAIF